MIDDDPPFDVFDLPLRELLKGGGEVRRLPIEGAPGPNPISTMLNLADALRASLGGADVGDVLVPVDDGWMPVSELRGGARRGGSR